MDLQTTTRKTRRVVLYGAAGTRKTTTAAQFPKPLVVQDSVARGAEFLKCPKATLTSADELGDAMKLMREGKFQTLVLDDFAAALRRFVDAIPESRSKSLAASLEAAGKVKRKMRAVRD